MWPIVIGSSLLILACAVITGVLLRQRFQQYFQDGQAWRDQGVVVMRTELSQLPPPEGSEAGDMKTTAEAGRGPRIFLNYSLADNASDQACAHVHDYYDGIAAAAGWTHGSRSSGAKEIISRYNKKVSGHDLRLTIDCFVDQVHDGQGYTLDLYAPQPILFGSGLLLHRGHWSPRVRTNH
jgi:hypothetical protein